MTTEFTTCEIWLILDEDGDYSAGSTEDNARENYEAEIGGDLAAKGIRRVCVTVKVPLPKPLAVEVTVEAESDEVTAAA